MADTAYLASALVTAGLLLAVWAFVSRMENWRRYDLPDADERRNLPAVADSTDSDESVGAWIAGFLVLAAVAGGGAVLLVSDAPVLAAVAGGGTALIAVFGLLLGGYLLWGTYSSARYRGLPSAHAALLCAWLFGSLFVLVVAVNLVVAG